MSQTLLQFRFFTLVMELRGWTQAVVKLKGEAMQRNYAVSGDVKGMEAVEAKAKSFKARMTVRLAVAGTFHTSFMEPAVSRLEAALAATEIRIPRIPVISNVNAQPHADPGTIKKILPQQGNALIFLRAIANLSIEVASASHRLRHYPGKVILTIGHDWTIY
ncbi:similar to EMBRYO DEFECTIVE 3147 [Actinidia rufa]|uniref:Similar to EMBRYO DEFECTIVE 3147 n=1 Tax=Actinidia rufa TaxID=165716 RepID=A0A7J0GG65_9ERIC|nr:similar to EMBRYO DEFECTIVE 3147 [Actinidia rufa]